MNKYKLKSFELFGKSYNTIILGGIAQNLNKTGVAEIQVPYRIVNEVSGNAAGSQPLMSAPVVLTPEEMPAQLSADALIGVVIAKINAANPFAIELHAE